jgi:hypothetical protein
LFLFFFFRYCAAPTYDDIIASFSDSIRGRDGKWFKVIPSSFTKINNLKNDFFFTRY